MKIFFPLKKIQKKTKFYISYRLQRYFFNKFSIAFTCFCLLLFTFVYFLCFYLLCFLSFVCFKKRKCAHTLNYYTTNDHLLQCDCTIDFDNFDILASDTDSFRLFIKESLVIKRGKPVLNRTVESFPLKLFD